MKFDHLSASTVDTFAVCPRKGYMAKTLGVPKSAPSAATEMGSAVHEALEKYHAPGFEGELLDVFDSLLPNYKVFDIQRFADARIFLKEYQSNNPSDTPTISLEKEFTIDIGGHKTVGYIDRIDYLGNGVYKVVDYKTSWAKKAPWEVQDDMQLRLYDIAVRRMYESGDPAFAGLPEPTEVICELYYLRHEPVSTSFSDEERADTLRYLEYVGNQLEMLDEEPLPRLNTNCRYCDFKGSCSLYSGDFIEVLDIDIPASVDELVGTLGNLRQIAKVLKVRTELIEKMLVEEINKRGGASIDLPGRSVELATRKYKRYDWSGIRKALDTWGKYSKFDSKTFLTSANSEERAVVSKFTTQINTNPEIKIKQSKKRM
jgi:RecB family exonuclease